MEDRIINIETKVTYQEDALTELSDIIYRQQQQIDQLERLCQALQARLENLTQHNAPANLVHEIPPHY